LGKDFRIAGNNWIGVVDFCCEVEEMRKAAQYLAVFFIITQVDRVANFIHLYQPADNLFYVLLSYGQSLGLAIGVYLSFFFVRQPKVRWAAIVGIIVFGGADLFFNEFALIRTVSAKALIEADSSFAWISAEYLQVANQIVALAYGVLPTLASAILGWIQGGVDRLTDAELKPTILARVQKALLKMFDNYTVRAAIGIEAVASRSGGVASNTRGNDVNNDVDSSEVVTPKKWNDLNQRDVDWILTKRKNARGAIQAKYQVSNGTAGNWLKDLTNGARPWQDAKLPAKTDN
jgi:hypothetical protein